MAKSKSADTPQPIQIQRPLVGSAEFHILGTTPLVLNRLSEKVLNELLLPKGGRDPKNLKHDPYSEFLASPYIDEDPKSPTLITHLCCAFRYAIKDAAVDLPGSSKAELGRLTWVTSERTPIYGVPKMIMSRVRQKGVERTPDVRTRVIIPEWCCKITISFAVPWLNETTLANLLVAAGMFQGVADWRQGKGNGSYGCFMPVDPKNPDFVRILKNGGRAAQIDAMSDPDFYDDDTESLFKQFQADVAKIGKAKMVSTDRPAWMTKEGKQKQKASV